MSEIKVQGWMTSLGIAEAHTLIGEILHICVGGEILSTGTSYFDLFRFARVRAVRNRTDTDRICPHCGESAQIAFEVVWESGFPDTPSTEVCEHCADGRVTAGGDLLGFGK
jgi:hypothetical protein